MTIEEFEIIMDDEEGDFDNEFFINLKDDNAVLGLLLIRKYLPMAGVEGADHDVIFSVGVQTLFEAGITKEDALMLKSLNWMIQNDGLACFV